MLNFRNLKANYMGKTVQERTFWLSASKINGKFNTSIVLTVVFTAASAAHMKKSFPRVEIKGTTTMWHGMGLHYHNFTDCSEWTCVWYKPQVFGRECCKSKALKKSGLNWKIATSWKEPFILHLVLQVNSVLETWFFSRNANFPMKCFHIKSTALLFDVRDMIK